MLSVTPGATSYDRLDFALSDFFRVLPSVVKKIITYVNYP